MGWWLQKDKQFLAVSSAFSSKQLQVSQCPYGQSARQDFSSATHIVCMVRKEKVGNWVPSWYCSGDITHLKTPYSWACGIACLMVVWSMFTHGTSLFYTHLLFFITLVLLPISGSYLPLKSTVLFYITAKKENEVTCVLVAIVWLSPEGRKKGRDKSRHRTQWKLNDLYYPIGFLLL